MLKGSLKTSAGVSAKLKRAPYFSFVTPLRRLPLLSHTPPTISPNHLRQPARLYYNS